MLIAKSCSHTLAFMKTGKSNDNMIYDVIIYGASSFTGKLITEYFYINYPNSENFSWAIAGRNPEKLKATLNEIIEKNSHVISRKINLITADSNDISALNKLTCQTKVILTTVGPYAKYGSKLVQSCVSNGTDYCDLAGETQWIRKMIDTHQEEAEKNGSRIVHSCGFDSIPSDLGVFFMQREALKRFQQPLKKISLFVKAMKGGASGGTVASILNVIIEGGKNRDTAKIVAHPYSLNPRDEMTGPDKYDQRSSKYNETINAWTAPFIMAAINTRIVRRTNALLNYRYGKDFSYSESVISGKKISGSLKAKFLTLTIGLFYILSSISFTRKCFIEKLLPKPGQGPNAHQRKTGFFKLLLIGKTKDNQQLTIEVCGDRDPGYGSTSKMLSETAICLACDEVETKGGVWTPASALSEKLISRLQTKAGVTFKIL